jgi:hypothetical protein
MRFAALVIGWHAGGFAFAQDLVRLQGLVDGIAVPEHMVAVRRVIGDLPLVGMVRVDPNSHTVMIQAKNGHGLTQAGLNSLLGAKGLRIRCLRTLGSDEEFGAIDPATCNDGPRPHPHR